jgi:UDP-2-acetamido-2,6-beta-L-arabino-hexul-4-ose reductase
VNVLVTGAAGFVGKHLVEALKRREGVKVHAMDRSWSQADFQKALVSADFIFHLAGVNRPPSEQEFQRGNVGFTQDFCRLISSLDLRPVIVFTSSIQAALDNAYGRSKKAAEDALISHIGASGGALLVFRLKNIFGKWCRPNYNSVTATFCYNIARDRPIEISDENREIDLVHIDDVVSSLVSALDNPPSLGKTEFRDVPLSHKITLGDLARLIREFRESRKSLLTPDFSNDFVRKLYGAYLSYLQPSDFAYPLLQKADPRGALAEFVKSPHFGQVFISKTEPGVTRGNHYHNTKAEKFLVVEGEGIVRFRQIGGTDILEYRVSGNDFKVVDIPPGYTHSIENIGPREMVTIFWASEIFDPARPDTYFAPVK